MADKRGEGGVGTFFWIILTIAALMFFSYLIWGNPFTAPAATGTEADFFATNSFTEMISQTRSFESLWNSRAKPLDYMFGQVPEALIITTSEETAPIVMVGLWLLFLLAFGDLLSIFGFFTKPVAWVSAVIITIIAANLKIINLVSVALLTGTAFLGAFSVVASIAAAFVLFIMFHFGTEKFRRRLILRRAEDEAMRAVAGGKKAASGISVLKDIVKAAEDKEKK